MATGRIPPAGLQPFLARHVPNAAEAQDLETQALTRNQKLQIVRCHGHRMQEMDSSTAKVIGQVKVFSPDAESHQAGPRESPSKCPQPSPLLSGAHWRSK